MKLLVEVDGKHPRSMRGATAAFTGLRTADDRTYSTDNQL